MTTPSTSGEEGGGRQILRYTDVSGAGADGRSGGRKQGDTKLFRQETGPKLKQVHSDDGKR